jgi:light-regulated signal transduction histidine kinase (bacteriophytochrome)
VAHDLRAPLRAIDGFGLALLEDYADKLDDEGMQYLRYVREAAQQMARLIDDLLGLSRVARGELRRERVDLTGIARSVAAGLRRADRERRVELVVADGLLAEGDANLMTIAIENLIGNAWKYTGKTEAARIEVGFIEGERDEPRTYFVRDNGAGFDMAYAGKLFGMFQRLHANTEFDGNGIGLATVQRIIRRHGGRIWAEGAVGCGATFFFTLTGGARPPVLMSASASATEQPRERAVAGASR